jgi:hypothetical protein
MIARIPIRMTAALALTLGGLTSAVLTAAPPAQAAGCTQDEGHLVDPGSSIQAWDYIQCEGEILDAPVAIVDEDTGQTVAEGDGDAYYACNGSAETKYGAAGASFEADCGGPA